mgnify:CR=1 FL=1
MQKKVELNTSNISILPLSYSSVIDTVCLIYEYNGISYTQSGIYNQVYTSSNGCDSIITLAKDNGIKVEERKVLITEIVEAAKNRTLKEMFGTGTAVTVNPIDTITFREEKFVITNIEDSFASQLKQQLQAIQRGNIKDTYGWTSKLRSAVST